MHLNSSLHKVVKKAGGCLVAGNMMFPILSLFKHKEMWKKTTSFVIKSRIRASLCLNIVFPVGTNQRREYSEGRGCCISFN